MQNKLAMTCNEQFKNKIGKMLILTIASKTTKYLEIKLTKEAQNLYSTTYETLLKEIKGDLNN